MNGLQRVGVGALAATALFASSLALGDAERAHAQGYDCTRRQLGTSLCVVVPPGSGPAARFRLQLEARAPAVRPPVPEAAAGQWRPQSWFEGQRTPFASARD